MLAAGRLVYYKGFDHLVRAMRHVEGTLVIVGDGPDYSTLEQLAWDLGVRSRVVFAGHVEDVRPYYHAADVLTPFRSTQRGVRDRSVGSHGLPQAGYQYEPFNVSSRRVIGWCHWIYRSASRSGRFGERAQPPTQ